MMIDFVMIDIVAAATIEFMCAVSGAMVKAMM
jgi:hypothetical protein